MRDYEHDHTTMNYFSSEAITIDYILFNINKGNKAKLCVLRSPVPHSRSIVAILRFATVFRLLFPTHFLGHRQPTFSKRRVYICPVTKSAPKEKRGAKLHIFSILILAPERNILSGVIQDWRGIYQTKNNIDHLVSTDYYIEKHGKN